MSKLAFLIMRNSLTKLNTLAILKPLAFMHTIPTNATKLHFHTPITLSPLPYITLAMACPYHHLNHTTNTI